MAKAKPGQLNYATGPTGTVNHMAGEMFMYITNLTLVRISYNGTAPALTDLLTGQVQLMFANEAVEKPQPTRNEGIDQDSNMKVKYSGV